MTYIETLEQELVGLTNQLRADRGNETIKAEIANVEKKILDNKMADRITKFNMVEAEKREFIEAILRVERVTADDLTNDLKINKTKLKKMPALATLIEERKIYFAINSQREVYFHTNPRMGLRIEATQTNQGVEFPTLRAAYEYNRTKPESFTAQEMLHKIANIKQAHKEISEAIQKFEDTVKQNNPYLLEELGLIRMTSVHNHLNVITEY